MGAPGANGGPRSPHIVPHSAPPPPLALDRSEIVNARTLAAAALLLASPAAAQEATPAAEPQPVQSPATSPSGEPQRPAGTGPIDPAPPAGDAPQRPPPSRTIQGSIAALEVEPRRVVVDGKDGPITVAVDRNTAIYLQRGLGTLRDLRVGEPVLVSISGADNQAHWLELTRREEPRGGDSPSPPTIPPGDAAAPAGMPGPPGSAPVPPGPTAPGAPGAPAP
jgi:hypothetical protein